MTSRAKKKQHGKKPLTSRRSFRVWVVTVLAAAGIVAVGCWFHACHVRVPLNAATAPVSSPQFQILKGRWLRPDGGYVVEIRGVDTSGKMDAAYFNPRPINVAKAEASQDGGAVKVSIELRDVNYDGSTYHLTYDTTGDRLKGTYFHAGLNQTFDVLFLRMKS